MKQNVIGVLSGILLVCVLAGNAVFSAFTGGETVQTMTQMAGQVELPVLMYHQVLKDSGQWGDYVISPQEFENDLKQIKKEGYTTVTTKQIENFLNLSEPLPEKPILITFDDGYASFYEYVYPLLQEYEMNAVVSIIGKYTDLYSANVVKSVSYSHVTWEQLDEMVESGLVEVGNHTYEQHRSEGRKGISKLKDETDQQYEQFILGDVGVLNQEIEQEIGIVPTVFAYPFGARSELSDEILQKMGFHVLLTCEGKVNCLDPTEHKQGDPIILHRFNRPSGKSSKDVFSAFD